MNHKKWGYNILKELLWKWSVFRPTKIRYFGFIVVNRTVGKKDRYLQYRWPLTDSTKINRPVNNIPMHWTNYWQQNIFEKNLIDVGSTYLYGSFGTFCAQMIQICAAQLVFKHLHGRIAKSPDIFLRWKQFVDFQTCFKDSLCLE